MKKILIISNIFDYETSLVIDWINKIDKNITVKVLNIFDHNIDIHIDEKTFLIKGCDIKEFNSLWIRKVPMIPNDFDSLFSLNNKEILQNVILKEQEILLNRIIKSFNSKSILGYTKFYENNKLSALEKANEIGLNIPKTIITSSKNKLLSFYFKCNKKIITKAISDAIVIKLGEHRYSNYTENVTEDFIESLNKNFYPTLFQEKIIPKYEVRIIFIDNSLYSTAIFHQSKDHGISDSRKKSLQDKLNYANVQLPPEIQSKLVKLMADLEINFGSIDMILSEDNNFYFLEVNPYGQYEKYSSINNYNIHKVIAKKIISL